jgi:hypothetical protein
MFVVALGARYLIIRTAVQNATPNQPLQIHATSDNGSVTVKIPSSYQGAVTMSTINGGIRISDGIKVSAYTPIRPTFHQQPYYSASLNQPPSPQTQTTLVSSSETGKPRASAPHPTHPPSDPTQLQVRRKLPHEIHSQRGLAQ